MGKHFNSPGCSPGCRDKETEGGMSDRRRDRLKALTPVDVGFEDKVVMFCEATLTNSE